LRSTARRFRPAVKYSVEPPVDATSAAAATIRLTGEIPANASHFTWNFGWTFASYAMTVRSAESDNPATQWLEGGDTSAPLALTSPEPKVDRVTTALRYLALASRTYCPRV